jgi:excisionase family DNA binding protein
MVENLKIENPRIDKLLTVTEVAEMLHVHPNTLRRWTEQGKIHTFRIAARGDRRFRYSDILDFLSEFQANK